MSRVNDTFKGFDMKPLTTDRLNIKCLKNWYSRQLIESLNKKYGLPLIGNSLREECWSFRRVDLCQPICRQNAHGKIWADPSYMAYMLAGDTLVRYVWMNRNHIYEEHVAQYHCRRLRPHEEFKPIDKEIEKQFQWALKEMHTKGTDFWFSDEVNLSFTWGKPKLTIKEGDYTDEYLCFVRYGDSRRAAYLPYLRTLGGPEGFESERPTGNADGGTAPVRARGKSDNNAQGARSVRNTLGGIVMTDDERNTFQTNVRKLIDESHMTIQQFSDLTGVARASISGYIVGTRIPNMDSIIQICKATGKSADWLLGIEGSEE